MSYKWKSEAKKEEYARWVTQFVPKQWTRRNEIDELVGIDRRIETISQALKQAVRLGYVERKILNDREVSGYLRGSKKNKYPRYRALIEVDNLIYPADELGMRVCLQCKKKFKMIRRSRKKYCCLKCREQANRDRTRLRNRTKIDRGIYSSEHKVPNIEYLEQQSLNISMIYYITNGVSEE